MLADRQILPFSHTTLKQSFRTSIVPISHPIKKKFPLNVDITEEFAQAFELMENSDRNLFITGRAGTGKSTLLRYFRTNTQKNIVVLAPTGLAAINVRGQTVHSFFKFPPHPISSKDIKWLKEKERELFQKIDAIVIDEISMVRADVLDAVDYFMRINGKQRSAPFGGVQMIFIGDLFQLPPVISSDIEKQLFNFLYDTPYFFSAHSLHAAQPFILELTRVFRQTDSVFLNLLEAVRTKEIDTETLHYINDACYKRNFVPPPDQYYITLTATNYTAEQINRNELNKINAPEYSFKGDTTGEFNRQKHSLPNDEILTLKEGAQVMFVRNDQWHRWVNGTIGKVQYVDNEIVCVEIKGEHGNVVHRVEQTTWEIVRYTYNEQERKIDTEVVGTFNQLPLKLAWAITIHKSQGQTFSKLIIDMGRGAFAPGQVYVALSRCTTLNGIVLKKPLYYSDIIIDRRIADFWKNKKFKEQ